jgi:hypothetical protein
VCVRETDRKSACVSVCERVCVCVNVFMCVWVGHLIV